MWKAVLGKVINLGEWCLQAKLCDVFLKERRKKDVWTWISVLGWLYKDDTDGCDRQGVGGIRMEL